MKVSVKRVIDGVKTERIKRYLERECTPLEDIRYHGERFVGGIKRKASGVDLIKLGHCLYYYKGCLIDTSQHIDIILYSSSSLRNLVVGFNLEIKGLIKKLREKEAYEGFN